MARYLTEMFPLPGATVSCALLALASRAFLARIRHLDVRLVSAGTAVAFGSFLLMILILRLMDELKDQDVDRALFAHRPLPSGKVRVSDIRISIAAAAAAYFALNLASPSSLGTAALAFGYSLLMYRFFFIPRILRRNLFLALATHNPIIPILLLHVANVFAAESGFGPGSLLAPPVLLLVLMHWSAFFAWEISRKIRSPGEENDYVTYSRILGHRGAVALAAGAQAVALAAAVYFYRSLDLSPAYPVLAGAGFCAAAAGHLRFLLAPGPATSRLRPWAEGYILWVLAAQLAGHFLSP